MAGLVPEKVDTGVSLSSTSRLEKRASLSNKSPCRAIPSSGGREDAWMRPSRLGVTVAVALDCRDHGFLLGWEKSLGEWVAGD